MILRVVFGSTLLVSLVHGTAWACSCISVGGVNPEELADKDITVWGEVKSVRVPFSLGCSYSSSDPVHVRLEVLEAFAGAEVGDTVMVQTARSDASCGVPFEVGQRWVVMFDEGGSLGLCGSGHEQVEADDDPLLVALRAELAR